MPRACFDRLTKPLSDVDANTDVYGQGVSTERILFGELGSWIPAQVLAFVGTLNRAPATSGRK